MNPDVTEEQLERIKEDWIKRGYNIKDIKRIDKPWEEYKKEQRKLGYKLVLVGKHRARGNRWQKIKMTPEEIADDRWEQKSQEQNSEESSLFATLHPKEELDKTFWPNTKDSGFYLNKNNPKMPLPTRPSVPTPWGEWETGKEKIERLKKEKEEDREFANQLLIQFNRRVRDNPHINYSGDSFGGSPRKGLKEKVEDLLNDPYYPEKVFNSLKLDTILVANELDDTKKELKDTKKELAETKKKSSETLWMNSMIAKKK